MGLHGKLCKVTSIQQEHIEADKTEKTAPQRGRPLTNKLDQIKASPQEIAKAIFNASNRKLVEKQKPKKANTKKKAKAKAPAKAAKPAAKKKK